MENYNLKQDNITFTFIIYHFVLLSVYREFLHFIIV